MRIELIGGPFCGATMDLRVADFGRVWISHDDRVWNGPGRGRELYRRIDHMRYLWVGKKYVTCKGCGCQNKEGAADLCGLCGQVLT